MDTNQEGGNAQDHVPLGKGEISNDYIDREFLSMSDTDQLAQKYQGEFSGAALLKLIQPDKSNHKADQKTQEGFE